MFRHLLLALTSLVFLCADASAQSGRSIVINGNNNTVDNSQSTAYHYHYSDNRTYTNSFNSHSGNTNSYNTDNRSNYDNTTTTNTTTTQVVPASPICRYSTPCGKPPGQCRCQQRQPACPRPCDPCPRLTFSQTQPCWDWTDLCVRCWDPCGKYFIDTEGRRWNLSATASPVPRGWQRMKSLRGRLYTDSNGILKFTVAWTCPDTGEVVATRTFIDP
jgi:hypothetical protein